MARDWGAIITGSNTSVCWHDVTMTGNTVASLLYSNGEPAGDRFDVTFRGNPIGSLPVANCGAWEGSCTTSVTSFPAQSGTGTLCLTAQGGGWIAALSRLSVE
jgi:hypothetical protein